MGGGGRPPEPPPAGFLIRPIRKAAGLTQAELARRVGVDVKTMNSLECGRSGLSLHMACLISHVLGVSPQDLVSAQLACELWRVREEMRGANVPPRIRGRNRTRTGSDGASG